jgi:signal peptidase I
MWMIGGVAIAVALAAVVIARRRYLVVSVVGNSMLPTLHDGQRLLARRRQRARRGDVVAFLPPAGHRHFADLAHRVKRVAAIAGDPVPPWLDAADPRVPDGKLVVLGDNPNSEDSRHYGYVDEAAIVGVVTGQ